LVTFEVDEGDASWPKVKTLIEQWNPADFVRTDFSEHERITASFLQMFAGQNGYPQPEDDFSYRNATYDLKEYCPTCGIGKKQIAPFRMKGEPRWGKKSVFQLNWIYDDFFVQPTIWEEVFRPLGIGRIAVIDHRSGNELQTVVQLELKTVAKSALLLDGSCPAEICAACGREKHLPISRGFFPAFASDPEFQIGRTQELFGSGASAWHATIVSQAVYKALNAHKIVGLGFHPLKK